MAGMINAIADKSMVPADSGANRFYAGLKQRWRAAARFRGLTYAILATVFCGATGLLEPVDDAIRNQRYEARDVAADPTIVVVGIDDKSLAALDRSWPWPRARHADLIANLKKAGARKIVYDMALADRDTPANDSAFIAVAKKYRGDIFLGAGFGKSTNGEVDNMLLPAKAIRPYAGIATFKARFNVLGQMDEVYTRVRSEGAVYPSLSTVISGKQALSAQRFRPDFSIRPDGFQYLSASDVILDPGPPGSLDGKDVLIGNVAASLRDIQFLPRHGARPGVFLHAIAAQTLKTGTPVDAGWLPFFALACVASLMLLRFRNVIGQVVINTIAFSALALGPILLDAMHISVEVAPATLLLALFAVQNARLRLGWRKSRTNEASGLGNVIALRELESRPGTALVAAKIINYAAIIASFPRDVENVIVAEIVGRLRLRDDSLRVYHADDGVFYWLVPIKRPADVGDHLDGLKAVFTSAMKLGDRRVDVLISFGADLDWTRPVASRAGSALMCAEEALRTGQRWKLYDPTRTVDAIWELSLASEIDRAMDQGQFWLAYQPKLDLKTNRITGAEILLRWTHPERGEINPVEFIPVAERSQRIGRLTDYVVARALVSARTLLALGDFKLAVNVSVPTLGNPLFSDSLLQKCEQQGVPPERIMVEITESVLMSADDLQVETTLAQLRSFGFGLSIDDFGTGFSSLEYVRRIPAHEMKIDQSFVKRLTSSPADRVVVESVLRMAHDLDRSVVAEGVENNETLELLRELGCDEAQGFYVGRPMPFWDFCDYLQRRELSAA